MAGVSHLVAQEEAGTCPKLLCPIPLGLILAICKMGTGRGKSDKLFDTECPSSGLGQKQLQPKLNTRVKINC
ncbi:hypothetical protein Y1Q_0016652 [Alligator mississippiensis]|uniref:Uncharacterized protein n=1 Tax=Alligator mississippiensis TaxID=8496 RepID=A0A151P1V6_ALLMI|nr:hypothetical protein Y1Q_0016652 [Alligator mississippiensis]